MYSTWLLCYLVLLLSPETSASCSAPSFHTNSTFGKNSFTFVYGSIFKVICKFDCDDLDDFEYIIYWERSFRTDKDTNATMTKGFVYIDNGPPQDPSPSFEMTLSVSQKTARVDANQSRILVREKLSGYETRSHPIMLIYPTSTTTTSATTTPATTTMTTNTGTSTTATTTTTVVTLAIALPCGVAIFSLILVIVILHGRRKNRRNDFNEQLEPAYMTVMEPTMPPSIPPRQSPVYVMPNSMPRLDSLPSRPAPLPPHRQSDAGYLTMESLPKA